MSEEEKEAIRIVNSYLLYSDINKTENDEACELVNLKVSKAMKKVVNLIEKQNRVIDRMAEQYKKDAKFNPSMSYGATKEQLIEYFYKEIENE